MNDLVQILSTVGLAILAVSSWVLISSAVATVHVKLLEMVNGKSEAEWAWIGLPVGGGILLLAAIFSLGLSLVSSGDECLLINGDKKTVASGPLVDAACAGFDASEERKK